MLLSVVVPVYNESEGLDYFHNKLLLPSAKKAAPHSYELIYVNDGSKDTTLSLLHEIAKKDKSVKIVNLSRNFGKEIATTAGISVATSDVTIIMDGDGQHPPELIPEFMEKWRDGAQVVIGVRNSNQKEGFVKKYGSKIFYQLFNSTSGSEIVPRSTDYRLIDASVREEFNRFTERNRITRGLIDWLGFKREYIEFDSPSRIAGEATYKTSQLIKLALNSFISLSLKPLLIIAWVGIIITALALLMGIFVLVEQILLGDPMNINVTGTAMLGILTLFLVGLILTSQGILALYLSHVHAQTQDRPLFVIDKRHSENIT
jgi:dolichol-phosphate mannosyltransferase